MDWRKNHFIHCADQRLHRQRYRQLLTWNVFLHVTQCMTWCHESTTHHKYQYEDFGHSVCFYWLSYMQYALVMIGSSWLNKMFMNFNWIMRTVNILFPHLEKKCRSLACLIHTYTHKHINQGFLLLYVQKVLVGTHVLTKTDARCRSISESIQVCGCSFKNTPNEVKAGL